jgi:hypothetical protein
VARFRPGKKHDKAAPRGDGETSEPTSRVNDLVAFVDEHMLGPEDAAATAKWFPSRRGNSPRGTDRSKRA